MIFTFPVEDTATYEAIIGDVAGGMPMTVAFAS